MIELARNIVIGIQIDPNYEDRIDETHVSDLIRHVLQQEESLLANAWEVGLVISDDEQIRDLNRQFRGLDASTDVLSFAMTEGDTLSPQHPDIPLYLGDVIVSYPQAENQALAAGHPVADELDLLIVHGVLHLLGHDHETDDGKAAMWAKQEAILGKRLVE